jgi:hypothetical protein
MGAIQATVGGQSEAAVALYSDVMQGEAEQYMPWFKEL